MAAPNRTLVLSAKGGCNGAPLSLSGVEIMKKYLRRLFGAMALPGALLLASPAQAQTQAALPAISQSADGVTLWNRVGASPVKSFKGGVDEARSVLLTSMGFNVYEVRAILDRFNTDECIAGSIRAGDEFEKGSFLGRNGRPKVTGKVRLTDTSEESFAVCRVYLTQGQKVNGYTLTRDITVTLVDKCANIVIERRPPPPPVIELPPPPAEVPPAPPPPVDIPPPPVAKKFCENIRLNLVVGAEVEIDPARAWSLYGAWGVYCMQKLRDGEIGFGLGGQHARYGSGPGNGKFRGGFDGVGPSIMRVWDRGQDLEAKLMFGKYWSDYRETDYRSRERADVLAVSVAHNDYSGRVDGSGRPERQIFALAAIPVGGSSGEWWQGEKISEGSHLQAYLNFGVRQYLQKEDPDRPWNLYAQVGGLAELRSGDDYFSCSFRLGATNKRRTFGIHAGINTCNGGIIPAIGAWYDLGNDLAKARADRRLAAVSNDNGEGRMATTTFTGRKLAMTRE